MKRKTVVFDYNNIRMNHTNVKATATPGTRHKRIVCKCVSIYIHIYNINIYITPVKSQYHRPNRRAFVVRPGITIILLLLLKKKKTHMSKVLKAYGEKKNNNNAFVSRAFLYYYVFLPIIIDEWFTVTTTAIILRANELVSIACGISSFFSFNVDIVIISYKLLKNT